MMLDPHFDLAYFIEGTRLNADLVDIFLKAYGVDDIDDVLLKRTQILVNLLTIL